MAQILQPPTPLFASRGGTSIKSFKFRGRMSTSSSPPSIGGDSTRRRAFGISSLLGRRKNEPPPPPDLDALVVSEKLLLSVDPFARESMDSVSGPTSSRRENRPAPSGTAAASASKQTPVKSRTLFRKITTKFGRTRSRSPSPSRRAGPSAPTASAQEARNAALRARGLLPSLPLSVQEQQQDMRLAIVASPEPGEQSPSTLERRPTAANRIKEEWEAKNRERLTEFRFGGSPASSPRDENFPARELGALKEVDTPLPSPNSQDAPPEFRGGGGAAHDELEHERKAPRAPPPTLNLGRVHHLSPPLMQAWSDTPPDPFSLPLPPSPGGTSAESRYSALISAFSTTPLSDAEFTPMSPTFLPLPPSPGPSSGTSIHEGGAETPRRQAAGECTPRQPASPTDESAPSPPRLLDGTSTSESESSLGPPSLLLDSASQTTVSTADSSLAGGVGHMRGMPGAKVRNSTFEAAAGAHHAISVIVESPREEREFILSPVDAVPAAAPKLAVAPPRRRATDPASVVGAAPVDRHKSLNVFKRGKGEGLSTMMSIRRAVGFDRGGRAKSAGGPPAGFDVTKLPPSPTLPAEFGAQQQRQPAQVQTEGHARARAGHAHRLSVNPKIHDRGSILFEVGKIDDEESRRMTEVAFM